MSNEKDNRHWILVSMIPAISQALGDGYKLQSLLETGCSGCITRENDIIFKHLPSDIERVILHEGWLTGEDLSKNVGRVFFCLLKCLHKYIEELDNELIVIKDIAELKEVKDE